MNQTQPQHPGAQSVEAQKLSTLARQAWARQDWATVDRCATRILALDERSAEGFLLLGLTLKAAQKPVKAIEAFEKALALDASRYDAAIELASQYSIGRRNAEAAELIARYTDLLENSPRYLDMAATVYTEIGLAERAWPLYQKCNTLQPGVDLFMANLAACGVYLGKIEEAKDIYRSLLARNPAHQRNHYQLARLDKARDDRHIGEMQDILRRTALPDGKNIFMWYALGKELEDLERWQDAFEHYRKAGDAVAAVTDYDIANDLDIVDAVIDTCNRHWLENGAVRTAAVYPDKTPVFIVGLPRTGTTLVERIVSSHSDVQSLGETQFMQMVIRRESGVKSIEPINSDMIRAAALKDITRLGRGYLDAVSYRLRDERFFIDKLPYNFLFLGFIAKAYPHARIVHMRRNPMDSCFAMYKQVFTWAYKFSYTLPGLGQYYVAHERLARHWRAVLGERMIEVDYESLVADQEGETRRILQALGLPFEPACLDFYHNEAATTTASSVQVRERVHSRSVNRWKRFASQLQPLRSYLERHGIAVE